MQTATNAQIRTLRAEAEMAGDYAMASLCEIALGYNEDGDVAEARAKCAKVIIDWQAEMAAGRDA